MYLAVAVTPPIALGGSWGGGDTRALNPCARKLARRCRIDLTVHHAARNVGVFTRRRRRANLLACARADADVICPHR